MSNPNELPGTDEALNRLAELEAADAATAPAPKADAPKPESEQVEQLAAPAADAPKQETTSSQPTDTPAAPKAGTDGRPIDDKGTTNYERAKKATERKDRSWEALNAEKDAFKAEQEAHRAALAKLQQERQEFEEARKQHERQFTPEAYEQAAAKFEADGKLDLADLARDKAKELRANPPKPAGEAQEAQRREWTLKAGVDFPELAKQNSPLQVRVSQLMGEEPELKAHPRGVYYAARVASLEADVAKGKADAARVPGLEKELATARNRITELEKLTAPGGEGGPTRLPDQKGFGQMSPDEQWTELQRQAQEVGTFR